MEIFVGNLSFSATKEDLKKLFEAFGEVSSVVIITEKNTEKSRGFGFVTMPDEQKALEAIASLNNKDFIDRPLNVDKAQSKPKPASKPKAENLDKEFKTQTVSYQSDNFAKGEPIFSGKLLDDPRYVLSAHPAGGGIKKDTNEEESSRRRSFRNRSFGAAGEDKPFRKSHAGPYKKSGKPRPWNKDKTFSGRREKTSGEYNSGEKPRGNFKPWQKNETGPSRNKNYGKPWKSRGGENNSFKPKSGEREDSRPWEKSIPARRGKTGGGFKKRQENETQPGNSRPRRGRPGGSFKVWQKNGSEPSPRSSYGSSRPGWGKERSGFKPRDEEGDDFQPYKKSHTAPWVKPGKGFKVWQKNEPESSSRKGFPVARPGRGKPSGESRRRDKPRANPNSWRQDNEKPRKYFANKKKGFRGSK